MKSLYYYNNYSSILHNINNNKLFKICELKHCNLENVLGRF